MTVQCGLSSMKNGASASRPTAWLTRGHSCSESLPVCSLRDGTRASAASRRFVSSRYPISIEKNSTGLRPCSATCWAMPSASEVFPCPGRAAMIVSVDGCMPSKQRVEVVVAGGGADDVALAVVHRLELVHRLFERGIQRDERVGDASLGDLEDRGFGPVERLVDRVLGRVRHLLDAARGLDEAAQHRELGDDLGVVLRVRRRRGRRLDPQQRLAAAELRRAARPGAAPRPRSPDRRARPGCGARTRPRRSTPCAGL